MREDLEKLLLLHRGSVNASAVDAIEDVLVEIRLIADEQGVNFYFALDASYMTYCEEKDS